jgi:hypothetical protein
MIRGRRKDQRPDPLSDIAVNGRDTPPLSSRHRVGLVIIFGIFAVAGAALTLYLGVAMLAAQLQPATRRFEDLTRVAQVLVLPFIGMTASMGVGAGIAGLVISGGAVRLVFAVAIALTLIGLACSVAALR